MGRILDQSRDPVGGELLPVLPLDVVVFPGMTVPVTATEERYKRLVRLALAQDSEPKRVITVLAPPAAPIRDMPEHLERFGTLAHLLSVEETEEGFDLVLHGQERCEVTVSRSEEVPDGAGETRPLHFAEYRPAPVVRGDPNAEAVAAWDAIDTFRAYAGAMYKGEPD
ncbi:MAG TPA: LON peptidase substrate-binding domain-containing protein, partial [Trueperaceae bacterium]|nr:LON peptidase substrate-binding domain-containing protein [Trueperaceae bacterium]